VQQRKDAHSRHDDERTFAGFEQCDRAHRPAQPGGMGVGQGLCSASSRSKRRSGTSQMSATIA
jgi:hypothetical protein